MLLGIRKTVSWVFHVRHSDMSFGEHVVYMDKAEDSLKYLLKRFPKIKVVSVLKEVRYR